MVRFLMVAAVTVALRFAASAQDAQREELQFLIFEALARNPEIQAELFKMQAAEERIPQAGALDDPTFTFKLKEFPDARIGQARYHTFELMQMIMFPTKLSTQKDIATLQAEHAHHEHLEIVLEVVNRLKSSYAMVWGARKGIGVNRQNQRLLEQIINSAQTQYSVGKVSQQDVLKASIELAKVRNEEASLRQEVEAAEAMLAAVLNRENGAPIGDIEFDAFQPLAYSLDELRTFARQNRPMVVHDSLSITESDLMLSMSRQEYIPDFSIGVERMTMPGSGVGNWTVSAGITIPFAPWSLSKASARVQEAAARKSMREKAFLSTQLMVNARVREQYAVVKAWEARVASFEQEILPMTERSLRLLLTEYQTGRTSYLMLIDGFRMYQETAMDQIMARVRYEQALASLEREVGVIDLQAIPKKNME
jgi:cobalt-zinc-cadmium efflux system outer membrane protein